MNAYSDLIQIRNHVQHGELFGNADEILNTVTRVFGSIHPIAMRTCPELLKGLEAVHTQMPSRLKALKEQVDLAWQVLIDYFQEKERKISIPFALYVTLAPHGALLQCKITGGQPSGDGSLTGDFSVPIEDSTGMFALPLDDEMEGRRAYLRAVGWYTLGQREALRKETFGEDPTPRSGLGLLFTPPASRKPLSILEDSTLYSKDILCRGNFYLNDWKKSASDKLDFQTLLPVPLGSFLSAEIVLTSFQLAFFKKSEEGEFSVLIAPSPDNS